MEEVSDFLNLLFPKFQKEYKGNITIEQAAEGIRNVVENAEDLLEDSLILFNSNKFPRSIALSIMAVEEISKIEIIKKILLSKGLEGKIWKDFKNHKTKNHTWYYPVLKKFGISYREVKQFEGEDSPWVGRIDDLKNHALYTNATQAENKSKFEWNLPKNLIDKDFSGKFLYVAVEVVKDDRILWDVKSLNIFLEHHSLIQNTIHCSNSLLYYKDLLELDLITTDRFEKIIANYHK